MSKEEIKEKYDIEPVMKEMWVWDYDIKEARLELVVFKEVNLDPEYTPFYFTWHKNSTVGISTNASETNPNEPKQQKVGDVGYFWNDDKVSYAYGKLEGIDNLDPFPYLCEGFSWHQHFSHENQPWMK
jgi:hypothetical protein